MESEYIDRRALIENCEEICKNEWNTKAAPISWSHAYANFIDFLEITPPADVAPVVHSRWIIGDGDDSFDVKCLVCGWSDVFAVCGIDTVKDITKNMHYCPNCGAKMDLEDTHGN